VNMVEIRETGGELSKIIIAKKEDGKYQNSE
jgi:hypothetical protein